MTEPVPDITPALSTAATLSLACSSCHAAGGDTGGMPSIAGYSRADMKTALTRYKTKAGNTVMHRYTQALSEDQITAVSDYLGIAP